MDTVRKLLIIIFGLVISIALSILVLIHGWGLEPKSWWWIIGVGFFGQVLAQVLMKIGVWDE